MIAISACIGLSVRQATKSAKTNALDGMSITSTISYDRADALGEMGGAKVKAAENLTEINSLT